MDTDLQKRRQALVDRHNALAPENGCPGAASEALCEVAAGLEGVAREAEARGDHSIEVGRTWRWAGMAYHDGARDRDPDVVRRSVAAYEQAERFTDRDRNVVDAIKNDYCMGRALMNLADGPDGSAAARAVERLQRARAAARNAAPELLPPIEEALVPAEQVAMLRSETNALDRQMEALKAELHGTGHDAGDTAERAAESPTADDVKAVFAMLSQQFDAGREAMDAERFESLNDIMESLAGLVDKAGTNRSLGDMAEEKETLDNLVERMKPLLRRGGNE